MILVLTMIFMDMTPKAQIKKSKRWNGILNCQSKETAQWKATYRMEDIFANIWYVFANISG